MSEHFYIKWKTWQIALFSSLEYKTYWVNTGCHGEFRPTKKSFDDVFEMYTIDGFLTQFMFVLYSFT